MLYTYYDTYVHTQGNGASHLSQATGTSVRPLDQINGEAVPKWLSTKCDASRAQCLVVVVLVVVAAVVEVGSLAQTSLAYCQQL